MDDLRSAAEAASSVLLELELDPTRELLEKASLTGVTAERWNAASAALLDAWAAQAELEAVIAQAGALRGRRQRESARALAPTHCSRACTPAATKRGLPDGRGPRLGSVRPTTPTGQ